MDQIEAQERELKARARDLKQQIGDAKTKNYRGFDMKAAEAETAVIMAEWDRLKFYRGRAEAMTSKNYAALRDGASAPGHRAAVVKNGRRTGRDVNPLALSEPALKELYEAQDSGRSIRVKAQFQPETKAFSSVDPLLPPQLQPGVVEQIHEWRLLDHLPTQAISAPSWP